MPRFPRSLLTAALALSTTPAFAQPGPPPGGPGRGGPGREGAAPGVPAMVERLLTFDANKDGSLTTTELTDERLHPLFKRADADGDGTATKSELTELFTRESAALQSSGRRGGPMGGPGAGGPGAGGPPPGERGPGGPPDDRFTGRRGQDEGPPGDRGPGRDMAGGPRGQRPRPGQILPPGAHERLRLTEEQLRRLAALQEIVDVQLGSILTEEQRRMVDEFGPPPQRGPGGEGPPRGDGPPRDRQRPGADNRPPRPANEP